MKCSNLMLFFIFIFALSAPKTAFSKEMVSRVLYFDKLFGHIHKSPSRYSQSLSTIGCGHPIKILKTKKGEILENGFYKVKEGPYYGFISKKYLNKKKIICFQDSYPRFFDNLELSLTDMYYWGKLYDQYVYGRSTVQ